MTGLAAAGEPGLPPAKHHPVALAVGPAQGDVRPVHFGDAAPRRRLRLVLGVQVDLSPELEVIGAIMQEGSPYLPGGL